MLHLGGDFQRHNSHLWAQANPLVTSDNALWSTLVWALCMTFWLGLLVILMAQWTDLPCVSAAQFACQVWEHLTATYSDRWIQWGRPAAWLSTSPDCLPMDFFLWGHMKALMDMLPLDSEEYLIVHIVVSLATIRQQPGIFECTHQFLLRCCLNMCSKLVRNNFLFLEYLSGFACIHEHYSGSS